VSDALHTLIDAAKAGDEPGVRASIARDPTVVRRRLASGESPLMAALYRGHHAMVDLLVDAGADVDVFAAAATGRLSDLERALRDPEAVRACAYDGWTPLHLAAFFGQTDAVRVLLGAGADVHAISRNSLENTALHAAVAGKHAGAALILLDHGANPDTPDAGGYTARTIARENRLDSVLAALAG
jgi:ankyrin repeat protein